MKRKIVQIAVCSEDTTQSGAKVQKPRVFALADDGTVFASDFRLEGWFELPALPENKVERDFIGGDVGHADKSEEQLNAFKQGEKAAIERKHISDNPYGDTANGKLWGLGFQAYWAEQERKFR